MLKPLVGITMIETLYGWSLYHKKDNRTSKFCHHMV